MLRGWALGCRLLFEFPRVKLLDYAEPERWAELEADFRQQLYAYEEQARMPYITTVEQAGIDKGVIIGEQRGVKIGEARSLLRQLARKFGPDCAERYRDRIEAADVEQLETWLDNILTAETPETIFH